MNLFDWDIAIFRWLNRWAGVSSFFDWTIIFRATYLWYIVVAAIAGFGVVGFLPRLRGARARNIRLVAHAAASALIAYYLFTDLIRFFFNRPRPFEALSDVVQLVPHAAGGSFPSGHAALSFAVAAAVLVYYPKTSIFFFLAAFSIGVARVAAGVHWPSDVIAGAIVGIATTWVACRAWKRSVR